VPGSFVTAVTVTCPKPPTSSVRRVHGSGSLLSATATAWINHVPSGTSGSVNGTGSVVPGMSTVTAEAGCRWTLVPDESGEQPLV
jgi:hypothetical protein